MNTQYKIVQIIDTLDAGGAERILVTLSNILFSKGHQVTVITTLQKGQLANQLAAGIELKELNRKSKWHLADMKKMVEWCKSFDIVHVHSSHNLRYLFVAGKLFGLKQKIFFHEHFGNIDIDESVSWHQKMIYPFVNLIAVSNSLYQWAINTLKLNKKQVFLLPNTITKLDCSNAQKIANPIKQIVLVSNFRTAKNIEFAINLMQQLVLQMQVHLTIIGQANNKLYVQQIQEQINAAHLNQTITVVHECNNVQAILHQFDLAIHTAKTESGPLVLIEYMAQQLPFLTYDTGEVVQQIKTTLPFLVMNNFNIDNWINSILQILNTDPTTLSVQLQTEFEKHFSEQAYYKKCLEIYSDGLA